MERHQHEDLQRSPGGDGQGRLRHRDKEKVTSGQNRGSEFTGRRGKPAARPFLQARVNLPACTESHPMGRYRIVAVAGLAVAMCGLSGCGNEPKFVRVSGTIKINGVPYDRAVISFQPMGTKENVNPGRGSSSYTDANGRFVLVCDVDREGAVVGKHRV